MTSVPKWNTRSDRPRGRPTDLKSGELQEQLLDVAEELFAEHGFAATSVRRVADQAGVNPALVHYYFGSKKKLLFAVIDRAVLQLADSLLAMRHSGPERVEDIATLLFSMAAQHPAMPRLITREVLLSAGDMRETFNRDYAPKLGGALPGLIRQAQKAGRISEQLDPGITALMVLSLCLFPFISRNVAGPVLGIAYDEEGLDRYLQHINTLFAQGITS